MNIRKLIILFLFVGLSACEQDVLYNSNLSNANTPKSTGKYKNWESWGLESH